MDKEELILKLYELGLIKIGRFKLSSGLESNYYIDLRELVSYPRLMKSIALMIYDLAKTRYRFDVVAGIATGGIPLASFISCIHEIPMAYIRRERKMHGMQKLIEGNVASKKVLLVDDVATTGGSLEDAVKTIREFKGEISFAIVVVDREQGALERLGKLGVELLSLVKAREIFSVLERYGVKIPRLNEH